MHAGSLGENSNSHQAAGHQLPLLVVFVKKGGRWVAHTCHNTQEAEAEG